MSGSAAAVCDLGRLGMTAIFDGGCCRIRRPRLEQWISSRQCYALLFLAAMMDELPCGEEMEDGVMYEAR
jgi:hypothetical protein